MKNSVCIDYLSFEWSSEDLIQAYRELKRQKSKTLYKILTSKDAKQLKKLHIEKNKQLRYENVLWRQINTNSLGLSNTLIDPCTLNWQKESDVTWLYGPLYMSSEPSSDSQLFTHPSLSFSIPNSQPCPNVKSILKKHVQRDYWRAETRYWSKCASDSGKQNVRFNPSIIEIQYYQHEIVSDDDEQDNDEPLTLFVHSTTSYIKSIIRQQQLILRERFKIVDFCISIISFSAWFFYQAILTMFNSQKKPDINASDMFGIPLWLAMHVPFFRRKSVGEDAVLYQLKDHHTIPDKKASYF